MKKYLSKIRKSLLCLVLCLFAVSAFAQQEADDGFIVPLDEDLSKAVSVAPATATGPTANIAQGIWIEATSSNKAIIRNISDGTKKGYEMDNSHFLTNANWWFWGAINDTFFLDAEISVWDTDKTLWQSNSYAANDPTVTWKEGIQSLLASPFSFLYSANDDGIGTFNKMGFTITTPWFNTKLGYGVLKANGMIDFDGIYYVIDRWADQGNGFTEISLGNDLRKVGNFTFDATAGFSRMLDVSGYPYGMYDLLRVRYGEESSPLVDGVFTFASATTSSQLFDYGDNATNALSAYLAVSPLSKLKLETHVLGTMGTDVSFNKNYLAFAGRVCWADEKWSLRAMESYAGANVDSVWGADGQSYDDINAGKSFAQVDAFIQPVSWLSLGLDEGFSLPSYDVETITLDYANSTTANWSLRNQPYVDLDLSEFVGNDFTIGAYGVIYVDKVVSGKKDNTIASLQEAGIELSYAPGLTALKKIKLDYATTSTYAKWTSSAGSKYKDSVSYHSVILSTDITDNFNMFGGMLYRVYATESATDQPLGFAVGCALKTTPLPGHPMLWTHFAYGMDPFEDNNYSLYRADDPQEKPLHRTYLLKTLDSNMTNSFIRLGLIWNL